MTTKDDFEERARSYKIPAMEAARAVYLAGAPLNKIRLEGKGEAEPGDLPYTFTVTISIKRRLRPGTVVMHPM